MQKTRLFTAIALCGVAAAPLASLAAGADTFANGQSYYGQPTPPQAVQVIGSQYAHMEI